ncbi:MAG: hypothetical protein CBC13_00705 [Planctomycetia bacterium TMED53]|nr:MAG: hypothetical protein CBC13_00705 [Planctomycetia bacterium TMED53]
MPIRVANLTEGPFLKADLHGTLPFPGGCRTLAMCWISSLGETDGGTGKSAQIHLKNSDRQNGSVDFLVVDGKRSNADLSDLDSCLARP